tara:strand:- start:2652 stop:5219 length:2568 start_codon:yes stop_codon:yes gene_type:complete
MAEKRKVTTKPKSVSKKAVSKKTVAKKTAPKKKSTATNSAKKSSASAKKSAKKTTKTTSTKKQKTAGEKTEKIHSVRLPSHVSPKAIEKVEEIKSDLDEYVHMSVVRVAYISSFCFMLVGSVITASSVFSDTDRQSLAGKNTAAVTMATETTQHQELHDVEEIDDITEALVHETEPFAFEWLTSLPDNLYEKERVDFYATGIEFAEAFLEKLGTDEMFEVAVDNRTADKYRINIDPTNYDPASYMLRVRLETNAGIIKSYDLFPAFFMGHRELEDKLTQTTSEETKDTEETHDITIEADADLHNEEVSIEADEKDVDHDSQKEDIVDSEVDHPETPEDVAETRDTEAEKSVEEAVEPAGLPELTKESVTEESSEISINLKKVSELSDDQTILIPVDVSGDFRYLELYARPLTGLREQFVGLAYKRDSKWQFAISKASLPAGEYEVEARSKLSSIEYKSNQIIISIEKEERITELVETDEQETEDQEKLVDNVGYEPREFSDPLADDKSIADESELPKESTTIFETRKIIQKNSEELNNLLRAYGVAVQGGDETTINLAEAELRAAKQKMLNDSLKDSTLLSEIDGINQDLDTRVEELQQKVRDFETLRKEKSETNVSEDSDRDGISDFDEINLYKTDPHSADSDQDGFNDNVEILRGFDPNDSKPEASIMFESPKDTIGLVRDDVLQVTELSTVTTKDTDNSIPKLRPTFRGTALPNSFVTLYIFSSPTVVTVKTDEDGFFEFTFDKELEDGSHDVYVAVTDNTGSIIAQSDTFSFVKTAEAFTPITEDQPTEAIVYEEIESPINALNMVGGISVISFGIILLMLGVGLRHKSSDYLAEGSSSASLESNQIETSA